MSEYTKKRRFKGTIVVEHDRYTAQFFLGKRGKEPAWFVGNVSVAYDFIENLRTLGHTVEVFDNSDEGEEP